MFANSAFRLEENRVFVAPKIASTSPSNFRSNCYKHSFKAEKTPPRVISFHTSATWRTFFEASKLTNKLIVVEFTATWCGPCRKMEPEVDEFAHNYTDVEFVKIDVDNLFDVSCEFGVQTMPTFLLMKQGRVIDKVTGARKEELQWKIQTLRA